MPIRRRIKKANIKFVSLVPKGANRLRPVYKDDGSFEFDALSKFDDEKGELTAVVYAPNLRDSQGDIADESVVKQMAHDYIANGAGIDIRHDEVKVGKDRARMAESFVVQKSDERFHGWTDYEDNQVDLTGAWATVIKIDDPELRKKYRNGEWAGVSMGGTAVVEQEKAEEDSVQLLAGLAKALGIPPKQPNPTQKTSTIMDEEKILKAITDGFTSLAKGLTDGLADLKKDLAPKQEKTETKKEFKAPPFYGDITDDEALLKHARRTQIEKAKHDTDFSDIESVMEFRQNVRAIKMGWAAEDEAEGREFLDPTEKTTTKKTAQTKRRDADEGSRDVLSKENFQDGIDMANTLNKAAGFDGELSLDTMED